MTRYIEIDEMPQGCILMDERYYQMVIGTPEDAEAIIESLLRMLRTQFPDHMSDNYEIQSLLETGIALGSDGDV